MSDRPNEASVLEQGLILIRQKLGKINVTGEGGATSWAQAVTSPPPPGSPHKR